MHIAGVTNVALRQLVNAQEEWIGTLIVESTTKKTFDDETQEFMKNTANLKLQVKRLESASRTVLSTNYGLEMQWQDNVVYLDGTVDTIRCLDYQDNYLTFKGCDEGDLLKADIFIVDTLVQFVHRVPKQWWFFKWGTKAIRQEVLSKNPHTKITYTEYIELQKKRKK